MNKKLYLCKMERVVIINGKKKCSICKEYLDIKYFRKNTTLKCKLHSQCNSCECKGRNLHRKTFIRPGFTILKAEAIKASFNINIDQYIMMLELQNNKCAICNNPEENICSRSKKIKFLSVDHNHETGEIRGLLCSKCNTGIGLLREDVDIFKNAIKYLSKYKKGEESIDE